MPTHDYIISNGTGAAVRADINSALSAIVSLNSSASEPATMYAYQLWADTTNGLLKIRNSANSAWITLRQLDGDFSIVAVEDGLQATPSLTFTNDLNTGIFRPGTDSLAIVSGGTRAITITSTQAVGIQTANPSTALHVAGNARVGADDVTDAHLQIGKGATGSRSSYIDIVADTTYSDYGIRLIRNNTGANATSEIKHRGTGNFNITTQEASAIEFSTSNTPRAIIDSSGRLLVGTSTARTDYFNNSLTAMLQVEGTNASGAVDRACVSIVNNNNATLIESPVLILGRSNGSTVNSKTIVSNGTRCGYITFQGADGSDLIDAANITGEIDGAPAANVMPGRLVFSTNDGTASASPTERMRIHSTGTVTFQSLGDVSPAVSNGVGASILSSSQYQSTVTSGSVMVLNRKTDDGTILAFRQDSVEEGTISVSGNTVSYNQFLGSHWAALTDWSRPEIKIGTILETINELTDWKYAVIEVEGEQKKICYNGTAEPGTSVTVEYEGEDYEGIVELETNPEFNKAVKVKVNDTAASKAVYGVFVSWNTDKNGDGGVWNDMYVGAVGNYVIRMAAGQEPEIGDLVEADGTGCAVVQGDDIIRTKTVAKITSTIPQVTYDDGSFLVTCVLYCG